MIWMYDGSVYFDTGVFIIGKFSTAYDWDFAIVIIKVFEFYRHIFFHLHLRLFICAIILVIYDAII